VSNAAKLPVIDMSRRDFWSDPYTILSKARERSAVGLSPGGQKLVLRHREVDALLRDPRMRTIGTGLLRNVGVKDGPLFDWWKQVMFNTDPPHHTRIRALVSRAFTARAVGRARPQILALAQRLLEARKGDGEMDLVADFAHPFPSLVTCSLLGVPEHWHTRFVEHTSVLGEVFAAVLPDDRRAACEHAVESLRRDVLALLEERRRAPRDDLLSALLAAEAEGDRLSSDECVALVINLLFAGHDTTRGMLSMGMALLLGHEGEAERLRANPELAPQVVEEVLRFEPPVFGSLRASPEEVEIAGVACRPGEPLNAVFPAATRDPRVYPDPDRFDVTRTGTRAIAFGAGIHSCLGASLARLEGEVAFPLLLSRLPGLRPLESPEPVPFAAIRRLASLRVAWDPH
jgi:cytochrome P450